MQAIHVNKPLPAKTDQKIEEEELKFSESLSTTITIVAVVIAALYYKEIGSFLGFSTKETPNSLIASFEIDSLNKYSPSLNQKEIILPKDLLKFPLLVCLEVQKIAKNLCSQLENLGEGACQEVNDFCKDLPIDTFINSTEKITSQLTSIEQFVQGRTSILKQEYLIAFKLKEILPLKGIQTFFCSITDDGHSIVPSLKQNLNKLMQLAAMKSSELFYGYYPAENFLVNSTNPMNRILNP